jgi:IS5 family transposase
VVPWSEFCALSEPYYPKAGNGRPPVGLERMLRMYFLANEFNLADEAREEALYDIALFRAFCRIDLEQERVPDATTLLHFRHRLEAHDLGAALFAKVGEMFRMGIRYHWAKSLKNPWRCAVLGDRYHGSSSDQCFFGKSAGAFETHP